MILLEISDFVIVQLGEVAIGDGTVENSTLRWDDTSESWDEFLAYLWPATDGNANQVIVTDGDGVLSFANQTAVAATIQDQVLSIASGILNLNYALGQSMFIDLTENVTVITFQNLPTGNLLEIEIEIHQDVSTAYTINWPSSFKFVAGTDPDLSTLGSTTLLHLRSRNNGTKWLVTFAEGFS